jgi:hypothetical protein
MEVTMSTSFILLMFCLSRAIAIRFFDYQHILSRQECLLLLMVTITTIISLLSHLPYWFSLSLYILELIINILVYYKKTGIWLVSLLLISLKYCLLVSSWFFTFDLPRIFFGLSIFNTFYRMLVFHFIQQLLFLALVVVAHRLFIKHEIFSSLFSFKEKYSILSVTYIINTVILILIRQYRSYPNYTDIFVLSSIMLICSLVLTFVFSLIISRDQRDRDKIYLSNRISHIEEARLEALNDFQHDYKNTLLILMELIKQQSYTEAGNYLKELLRYTDKQLDFPSYYNIEKIENIEMRNYIIAFYEKCVEEGVKLVLNTRGKCQPILMNPIDSTRMIAIMTNNALEACKELPHPSINIEFDYFQDTTVISVTNPCLNKLSPKTIVKKGYSNKPGHSGRGLFILNRILREYEAKFDIEYCNNQFIISATLPNR